MMLYVNVYKVDISDGKKEKVARFVCKPSYFLEYVEKNPDMLFEVHEIPVLQMPNI